MNNSDLGAIIEIVHSSFPDKTVVDISEYENEQHQTYKFLYENQCETVSQQTEEIYNLRFQNQGTEQELAKLRAELDAQKSVNAKLNNMTVNIMEFVEQFTAQEISVSNLKVSDQEHHEVVVNSDVKKSLADSITDKPGIYGDKRPSWFTPLRRELSKENAARRTTENTKHILSEKLESWKRVSNALVNKKISVKEAADSIDLERKTQIIELLNSECSNHEKYLKYFLLTPGLPKHFVNTLTGAAELGLDANVIIELLEQPKESFNAEIIEIYVSEAHKGVEFNLKKELAQELIRGEWYVCADINGRTQRFQMAPMEFLEELREKLDTICGILDNMANEEVCANLAQTSSDIHQNDEGIIDEPPDIEYSSLINFDDSML